MAITPEPSPWQTTDTADAGTAVEPGPAADPTRAADPEVGMWPGVMLAASMVLLTFTLMRASWRARARRRAAEPATDEDGNRIMPGPVSSGSPQLDRLEAAMADANELARHLAAALDNRAERLELLIEEADRKLSALDRPASPDFSDAQRPPPAL